MTDNRLLIKRITQELKEAVLSYPKKSMVGRAINLANYIQIGLLFDIVDKLGLNSEQDEDNLIIEVIDYLEDLPQKANINLN